MQSLAEGIVNCRLKVMNQNRSNSSKHRKLRSWWLLVFLFFLGVIIPLVAEVSASPQILRNNSFQSLPTSPQAWGAGGVNNPSQLVQQAKELYQAREYESALPLWKSAVTGYARSGDKINQAIALSNLSLTQQQLGQWEAAFLCDRF